MFSTVTALVFHYNNNIYIYVTSKPHGNGQVETTVNVDHFIVKDR